ncbi:MAG: lactate utilization protein [Candidatus Kryptonium sp.]|nr:lactate utilization protein [Candidatus Kryptonium sp.]MCX7761205.1 lactate utilization protein [Candidatus Kryptonium sp.]MDW8108557.1 lactate utilization protein [Candidatus Kryptonium sp.]
MEEARKQIIQTLKTYQINKTPLPEIETDQTPASSESVERFKFEFERVGGNLIEAKPKEIYKKLSEIISSENIQKIFAENFEKSIDEKIKDLQVSQIITQPHSEKQLADVDASITGCDFLIAETGTIVFIHRENKFKSAVLLPRIHIVIANKTQIISTFEELVKRIDGNFDSIFLITGPSRTADIEKVLVRGVHGPQKVYIILT